MADNTSSSEQYLAMLNAMSQAKELRALVVGGTAGIGLAVAQLISSDSTAQVTIAGRNESAGEKICQESLHKNMTYKKLDASLMKNVVAFCESYSKELIGTDGKSGALDILVLSQGIISAKYEPTSEGINLSLALNYYSRMLVIRELVKSGALASNALIVSVLNGQQGTTSGENILWNDMDCSRTMTGYFPIFSVVKIVKHNFSMQDIMLQALATESGRTFIHWYPGFVATEIMQNSHLPGPMKWIAQKLTSSTAKMVVPDFAAQQLLKGAVKCWSAEKKPSWYCMDDVGEEIVKDDSPMDVKLRVKEHTWSLIDSVLAR